MNLNQLLVKLSELNVQIWAEGKQLRIRAPQGVLTTKLRELITELKPELLSLLSQNHKNIEFSSIPLVSVPRNKNLPLSFEQERLWAINQFITNGAVHNITQAFRLKGQLNIEVLQRSINEIVCRHEALRTIFTTVDGSPIQIITPNINITLEVVNSQGLNPSEKTAAIQKIVAREAEKPFNLEAEALFNFKLLQLSESDFVLLLRIHHIIADAISVNLLIQELATLYKALNQGQKSPLPKLDIQYGDFAVWQRQWLRGEILEQGLNYWRKQLHGVTLLKLPVDRPRPIISNFQGMHEYFTVPTDVWSSLKKLSNRYNVTPFMTMLTGFNILLHHCCHQTDITVASPVSGRVHPQLQSLIGFFAYPILLRNDLSGNPDFEGLLKRVRKVTSGAYSHQNIPLSKVVEATKCESLVRVLFSFLGQNSSSINLPYLTLTPIWEASKAPTDMDLFLTLSQADGELRGVFEYNPDLFDRDTIIELINSYCLILEQCINFPQTKLNKFILTKQLEAKFNLFFDKEDNKTNKLNTVPIPKVAITGTFTTEPIVDSLNFWLRELDLNWQVEFSAYNQVFQQLYAHDSLLAKNKQGINVVLVRFEDWLRFEYSEVSENSFVEKIEKNVRELIQAVKTARLHNNTPLLLCLCPGSSNTAFLQQMEAELTRELTDVNGVYIVNSNELTNNYPVETFYDSHADKLGHVPFTQTFYNSLGTTIARKIYVIRHNPYKVIVLDCDCTLWNGICGEDRISEITIDENYQKLQEFMITQRDNGMLLCLCSKNNQEDVWEVFEQRVRDMLLKREHLISWRINWKSKSDNLKSLAQELQLGLDSFIFIDDNPVECAEVKANCPSVLTLQLSVDTEDIPRFLQHVWAFDSLKVTQEDKQRSSYYQQNVKREQLRVSSGSLGDFIKSLNLEIQITEMEFEQISRVSQLTQRTNQFNATTIRRSESDIQSLDNSPGLNCFVVHVKDRFSDYGLVGAIICAVREEILKLEVDTFLLSCRVLGRGVEHQILAKLGTIAIEAGLSHVVINYNPTAKNKPILDFLNTVGEEFKKTWEDSISFELPSSYCREIVYNPELTTATEALTVETEKSTSIVSSESDSTLINNIANNLYNLEQISKAIELQKQGFQNKQIFFVPPSTEIQKQLADLWSKILHLERVGIKDNFFELGGNSLIAVQLMSRIKETFQIDLPISDLLTVPTVEQLALSIETIQTGIETINSEHTFLDLDVEVKLDPLITAHTPWEAKQLSQVKAIFLTGATGFLGAFLLQELLQQTNALIYCLVRSSNSKTGQHEINKNLEKYKIWQKEFSNRIIAVPGDLSLPLLGLSQEEFHKLGSKVEIIFHNGAFVNFTYPYFKLKAANVLGTEEVLRLATQSKVKPVHFVSTVAVFDSIEYSNVEIAKETDLLPRGKTIYGGYAQTKWVAEKLIEIAQERGIPVCIYRPGAITGNSHTGEWNTDDAICRILRGIIQLRKIPVLDASVDMVPVDYVAKSIIHLSQQSKSLGQAFHLVNPQIVSFASIAKWICNYGYPLEKISYKQWQQELINLSRSLESNPLYPLLPLFYDQIFEGVTLFETLGKRPKFDCSNTLMFLATTNIVCPSIDNILHIYFDYLINKGLLEKLHTTDKAFQEVNN